MRNFGIYVHIPFCQRKCKYCDFASIDKWNENSQESYVQALLKEIENTNQKGNVTTIYFGGGTPSILYAEAIRQILQAVQRKFTVAEETEITLEVNPGTANLDKLIAYRKIGINRLSIGLQATQNRLLTLLGRIHTYENFLEIYQQARKAGFRNLNVDLMLGLPTQTLEELKQSLEKVVNLNSEHISLYSLILEEGTALEKLVNEKKIEMISEDLERQMYWEAKKMLEQNGYFHYEISNFAKRNFESKHNLACWNQEEYLGFGLAAHSYVNQKRFSNETNLEKYLKKAGSNKILQEKQNFEEQAKEYMMLGLRKIEGVSISKFEQKFQIHPLFYFRFEISKLEEKGLLEVDLDKIRLTEKGLDFANLVFKEFV